MVNGNLSRLRAISGGFVAKISILLVFSQNFAFFEKFFGGAKRRKFSVRCTCSRIIKGFEKLC
jgi:hypothetical protein